MKKFPGPFDSMTSDIEAGMANLLWWSAWSDRQEELTTEGLPSENLSGVEIANAADDPTPEQRTEIEAHVAKVVKAIEKANKATLSTLYKKAIEANKYEHQDAQRHLADRDRTPYEAPWRASEDQFGSCLAHMSMGSGVSWFDDNAKFELDVPYSEWGSCYLTWESPTGEQALEAYLNRGMKTRGQRFVDLLNSLPTVEAAVEAYNQQDEDASDGVLLSLVLEFIDKQKLGGDLHEFFIEKTGGR